MEETKQDHLFDIDPVELNSYIGVINPQKYGTDRKNICQEAFDLHGNIMKDETIEPLDLDVERLYEYNFNYVDTEEDSFVLVVDVLNVYIRSNIIFCIHEHI